MLQWFLYNFEDVYYKGTIVNSHWEKFCLVEVNQVKPLFGWEDLRSENSRSVRELSLLLKTLNLVVEVFVVKTLWLVEKLVIIKFQSLYKEVHGQSLSKTLIKVEIFEKEFLDREVSHFIRLNLYNSLVFSLIS